MRTREPNSGSFTSERLTRHGMAGTPTWGAWKDMKQRCLNPNTPNYHSYGGRGITVCERWLVFDHFLDDMGVRPDGMTLERNENSGNYEPGNCSWESRFHQANNTRRNRFLEFRGERKTISQWAAEFNVSRFHIRDRINAGRATESVLGALAERKLA